MSNFDFGKPHVGSTYPSNEGLDRIARLRKVHLAASQNRKQENAVMVDPVQSWVFIRQQAGKACTCQNVVSLEHNSLDGADYTIEDADPFVVSLQEDADAAYKAVFDRDNAHDYAGRRLDDDVLDSLGDELSLISGNDKGFCGICMNTGWTDGYRLHNGHRLLGRSTDEVNKSDDVEIRSDRRPITFTGTNGDWVEFKFRLPSSFQSILHAALHNNCNLVSCTMTVNGQPFNEQTLRQFAGDYVLIRVEPTADRWEFSHLDIWLSMADTFIDYPPVQRDSDFQMFEALQTIHFETIGSIPYVDRETVISEVKYGDLWKVSNATAQMTAEKQLIKTEVDARLVQTNEALYYLNFIQQPMKIYNYSGLERIQGYYNQAFNLNKGFRR